jgi:nitrite reductase/ring-hydroxylating ferredoxin subunit
MANQDIFLCNKSDLKQTGAFGATIDGTNGKLDIVIIDMAFDLSASRSFLPSEKSLKAYINSCPHLSMPMETFDHEFLDKEDPSLIVCSTHGARFRSTDGFCLSGPCSGSSLTPIPLTFTEEAIYLQIQETDI